MLRDRIGIWSVPHFMKQVIAESGLTPRSATRWPLWTFHLRQVIPTHFPTTCGAFRCTEDTTYAFCSIVESFAEDTFSGKMKFVGTATMSIYRTNASIQPQWHIWDKQQELIARCLVGCTVRICVTERSATVSFLYYYCFSHLSIYLPLPSIILL